jgi:hypothetical protein
MEKVVNQQTQMNLWEVEEGNPSLTRDLKEKVESDSPHDQHTKAEKLCMLITGRLTLSF